MLEVNGARVLTTADARDGAKQTQRRAVLECVAHHVRQKQAVAPGSLQHLVAQGVEQLCLAVNGAQVKENAGQHERHRFRRVHPLLKILHPPRARLTPLVGHGHHFAGAVDVPALGQSVAHKAGESAKVVAVRCLVIAVVQHQAIVLVGLGRLLAARLRTCRHPHIVHGGGPQTGFGQVDEPRGDGVSDGGNDVACAVGAGVGRGQVLLQRAYLGAGAHQALHCGLLVHVARQIDRRGAVLLCQIGGSDHANDTGSVHHGHVVNVVACHQQQRIERRAGRLHGQWRQGGNIGDRTVNIQALGHHAVAQIAVGDQAEQVSLLDQQHRRYAQLTHLLRCGANGRIRRHRDGLALDKRAHGGAQQVQMHARVGRWQRGARPCRVE